MTSHPLDERLEACPTCGKFAVLSGYDEIQEERRCQDCEDNNNEARGERRDDVLWAQHDGDFADNY